MNTKGIRKRDDKDGTPERRPQRRRQQPEGDHGVDAHVDEEQLRVAGEHAAHVLELPIELVRGDPLALSVVA